MDWIHLHLALNHIPVLGTPFILCVFLWSWLKNQTATLRFCLWLFVFYAAASIAIKFTGDFASEQLVNVSEATKTLIGSHEESADQATAGIFLTGIYAAAALFTSRDRRSVPRWSLTTLALIALLTSALLARTANLGGQIKHPEIRKTTSPPSR